MSNKEGRPTTSCLILFVRRWVWVLVLRWVDNDLTTVQLLCLGLSLCVCLGLGLGLGVCLGLNLSLNLCLSLGLSLQLSLVLGNSLLLVECQVFANIWRGIDVSVGVGRDLSNSGLREIRVIRLNWRVMAPRAGALWWDPIWMVDSSG